MPAPNQPRKVSFIRELIKVAVFASCVAFFGGMGIMAGITTPASADSPAAYPPRIVYYNELKNLGGGSYLCEVWSHPNLNTTLMKLTASEKAKLRKAYVK
jgi:hypothetical protein